ncbi:MAG: hypothetical protein EOM22_05035, partial [Gammaproteobacteria bacterium]|nr:hypothetical protein [Gammaproteobacteria bacterium]
MHLTRAGCVSLSLQPSDAVTHPRQPERRQQKRRMTARADGVRDDTTMEEPTTLDQITALK